MKACDICNMEIGVVAKLIRERFVKNRGDPFFTLGKLF